MSFNFGRIYGKKQRGIFNKKYVMSYFLKGCGKPTIRSNMSEISTLFAVLIVLLYLYYKIPDTIIHET